MSVTQGRVTATVGNEGVVVFLIGMRINQVRRVWKWLPVATSMPRMLRELMKSRELGLRGRPRTFVSGRTIMVLQYWESFEMLESYAHQRDAQHFPAWRAFNQRTRGNCAVGIFHETYVIESGHAESIYVNMDTFGLAAATTALVPSGADDSAAQRLGYVA